MKAEVLKLLALVMHLGFGKENHPGACIPPQWCNTCKEEATNEETFALAPFCCFRSLHKGIKGCNLSCSIRVERTNLGGRKKGIVLVDML